LLKPTSAGIERVWSIFTRFFESADISSALLDYIATVLMRVYNHRSARGGADVPEEEDIEDA
jgi:hypothetical protein